MNTQERRLYTRSWYCIPVNIFYNDTFLNRYYTLNLSVGGMLIEAYDLGLTENALVHVNFEVNRSQLLFGVKLPAVVLRCSSRHVAVSFEVLEKGTEELLNSIYLSNEPMYL